jgi:hypothetical protein
MAKSQWKNRWSGSYTRKLRKRHESFGDDSEDTGSSSNSSTNIQDYTDEDGNIDKSRLAADIDKERKKREVEQEKERKEAEERARQKDQEGRPKQSIWDKVKDTFDPNTEADKYRREKRGEEREYNDQQEVKRRSENFDFSKEDIDKRKQWYKETFNVDIEDVAKRKTNYGVAYDDKKTSEMTGVNWKELADKAIKEGRLKDPKDGGDKQAWEDYQNADKFSGKMQNQLYRQAVQGANRDLTPKELKKMEERFRESQIIDSGEQGIGEQALRRFSKGVADQFVNLPQNVQSLGANLLDVAAPEGSRVDKYAEERFQDAARDFETTTKKKENLGARAEETDQRVVGGLSEGAGSLTAALGMNSIVGGSQKAATSGASIFSKAKEFAKPGVVGSMFGVNKAGQIVRDAKENNVGDLQALATSWGAGYTEAVLENFGIKNIIGARGKALGVLINNGSKEGIQEFLQDMSTSGFTATYKDVDWRQATLGALESGAYGFVLGGGASIGQAYSQSLQEQGVKPEDADKAGQYLEEKIGEKLPTEEELQQIVDQARQEEGGAVDQTQQVDETGQPIDQTQEQGQPPIVDEYGKVLTQSGLPQDVRVQPQPEIEQEQAPPAVEPTESGMDWENNYAQKYQEAEDKVTQLTQQMESLPKAQQPPLKLQIDELVGQQKAMEEEFATKWKASDQKTKDKPVEKPTKPEVTPTNVETDETTKVEEAPRKKGAMRPIKKAESKDYKIVTIKTQDGGTEYVARLGNTVRDRVGRDTGGFDTAATSPNFKTEAEANKWVGEQLKTTKAETKPDKTKTEVKKPLVKSKSKPAKRVKPLGKNSVKRALQPLEKAAQDKYGKTAEKLSPKQISDTLAETKTVIKGTQSVANKVGRWQNGYTLDDSRPAMLYGGKLNGFFTDGYTAILDKTALNEMYEVIDKKHKADYVKTIQRKAGSDFKMAQAQEEAQKNLDMQYAEHKDQAPKLFDLIKTNKWDVKGKPAKIEGYYSDGITYAVFTSGSTQSVVQANYVAMIEHFVPGGTYYMPGTNLDPIQVYKNGKLAALIMPIKQGRGNDIPQELRVKEKSTNADGLRLNTPDGTGSVKFDLDGNPVLVTPQPRDAQGKYATKDNRVVRSKDAPKVTTVDIKNNVTMSKLIKKAEATPVPEGKQRVYFDHANAEDARWVWDNVDSLRHWTQNRAGTEYGFKDVDPSQLEQQYDRDKHMYIIKKTEVKKDTYGMQHRPTEGSPLHNLLEEVDGDTFAPSDIYDNPQYYAQSGTKADQESIAAIQKYRDNPNGKVTIYRASPKNELNRGDWVTLSPTYAKAESQEEGTPVHKFTVPAKDVRWAGDDLNEFGYFPESKSSSNSNALEISTKLEESQDPADIAMRKSLEGQGRPTGATKIEGNQTMTEAERLKATKGDQGQAGIPMTPEQRAAFIERQRAKLAGRSSTMNAYQEAKKADKRSALAKTPQELAELAQQLNKAGQYGTILRKGGLRSKKNAGEFQYKRGNNKNEEWVKLRDQVIENPKMYVTVLAHELSHAIEYNVNGDTKSTYKLFGDLSAAETKTIDSELRAIVDNLEGQDVAQAKPSYFYSPTEMLARYVETMILEPSMTTELAPTVTEKFELLAIRSEQVRMLIEAVEGNIDKNHRNKTPNLFRDLRQVFQKHLGKTIGDKAYDAEVVHRAEVQRAGKVIQDLLKYKFKGVKDNPQTLFRAAESIRVTRDGEPEFGTRDFQRAKSKADEVNLENAGYEYNRDVFDKDGNRVKEFAKLRYTAEEGRAIFNELSPEGQQLIKDFTAAKEQARDDFNREVIKDMYKIDANLEGWVHRGLQKEEKGRMVLGDKMNKRGLRGRQAAMSKQRGTGQNYLEDFQKQMEKALLDAEVAAIDTDFYNKQLARISKPIARNQSPDKGWVEVTSDLRQGLRLPGEGMRQRVTTPEGSFMIQEQRYQVPAELAEFYRNARNVPIEASKVSKAMNTLTKYWAINVLIHPGTTGTNAISGGLQYGAKMVNDFYLDLLTADIKMSKTRRNLLAPLQVLTPHGWNKSPDYVFGGNRSNYAGQFMEQGIADNAVDKYGDKALKMYGVIENYWKKAIAVSEGTDLSNKSEVKGMITRLSKAEKEMIASVNDNIDLFAYDYQNVPLWLSAWDNKGGRMVKPFMKYPYKYSKMVTNLATGAFDKSLPWQERTSKIMTLATMMALAAGAMGYNDDDRETPEGGEDTPNSYDPRGRWFLGKVGDGKEIFLRTAKYPFFNITTMAQSAIKKDWSTSAEVMRDMVGSVSPVGALGAMLLGYRNEFDKYTPMSVQFGKQAAGFIPGFRILNDIGRIIDPAIRKPESFMQAIGSSLPIPGSEETKAKYRGSRRQDEVPVEPDIRAYTDTEYTAKDQTYNQMDLFVSFMTGLYLKRVDVEDAKSFKVNEQRKKATTEIKQLLREGKEKEAQDLARENGMYIKESSIKGYRSRRKKGEYDE